MVGRGPALPYRHFAIKKNLAPSRVDGRARGRLVRGFQRDRANPRQSMAGTRLLGRVPTFRPNWQTLAYTGRSLRFGEIGKHCQPPWPISRPPRAGATFRSG